MKKTIALFFFLIFIATGLAAETGYETYEWGENPIAIIYRENTQQIKKTQLWDGYPPLIFEKEIKGFKTNLFYCFNVLGNFNAVFYYTDINNTGKIKDGLGKAQSTIKTFQVTEEDLLEEYPSVNQVTKDYIIEEFICSIVNGTITHGDGPGTVTIYNYNDDTWCYIFENVLVNKTCVVYAPKD